jgi:type VI secretion system secreted protein Hcp
MLKVQTMKTPLKSLLCTAVLSTVLVAAADASPRLFLKINTNQTDSIQGESVAAHHVGEIDVLSFEEKIVQPSTTTFSASGRASAAGAQFTPLVITKELDMSSPALMIACTLGTVFPKATLTISMPLESGLVDFFTLELTNLVVSSYDVGGGSSGGDRPTESLSLNFSQIKWTYRPVNADGQLGAAITKSFDLRLNRVPPMQ